MAISTLPKALPVLLAVGWLGCLYFGPAQAPVLAAPADLFFSEYIEGSGNSKALEIFNGTGSAVDLEASVYEVQFFFDGNSTPGATIALKGVVAPGDVFVLAGPAADPAILGQADQIFDGPFFNGNDAVALVKNGSLLDVLGQIGFDPGTQWGSNLTSTADNTLRRKLSVEAGDATGDDAFEPALEWEGFVTDTFAGLGQHLAGPPPTLPLTVVINEIAWAGTAASANDEWIELYNPGDEPVDLANWRLSGDADGQPVNINLTGVIPPGGYWLLERQDDSAITDIGADQIYSFGSGLANAGETLRLLAPDGTTVDTANAGGGAWPAGAGSPAYVSMERIDPHTADSKTNWRSNDTVNHNGLDLAGAPINGTPRQPNSKGVSPPPPPPPPAPLPLTVVINEVGWAGTAAGPADEWLELLNTTTQTLVLDGWVITSSNGLNLALDGTTLDPNAFYLIERSDDNAVSDIPADLATGFGPGLANGGDSLYLSAYGALIDTANSGGAAWPGGSAGPDYFSLERRDPHTPDSPANWASNDGKSRNGLDAAGQPINGTPRQPNSTTIPIPPPEPPATLLISEFLYDGLTPSSEGDEFIELCNADPEPVDLSGYKIGDEEIRGGGESMFALPAGLILETGACLVLAESAADFQTRFGFPPALELGSLSKYTGWGSGSWSLSNTGDELLLLGPADQLVDSVAYRNGDYFSLGLEPDATAPAPHSLQRVWPVDTDSMPNDFVRDDPTPGVLTIPPPPPLVPPPAAVLPGGMYAYWGDLHSHTTFSDGAGPTHYALALARAAGLHFYGITDHDSWLTPSEWTRILSQTEAATVPGAFVAFRGVEWSPATGGHITVFNSDILMDSNGPFFSDLSNFYTWLAAQPAAIAQFNHPDPSYGGTFYDFAFHPAAAQFISLQEIGNNAQGYKRYEAQFLQSNAAGWRVGPINNSDVHTAKWGTSTSARTGVVAPALTQAEVLAAMAARRVFATEDSNLALALRLDGTWMGSVLPQAGRFSLVVDVVDPDPEPLTLLIYDCNLLLASVPLPTSTGQWQTTVEAQPGHYFWVKAIQTDGDTAYSAPVWIEGEAPPESLFINEILPSPGGDTDWDGDGSADYRDEWIELYNPMEQPIGLGGWKLSDASGSRYDLPLGLSIPAHGFLTLYYAGLKFALNNDGDSLSLTQPNGLVVDRFSYEHTPGYDETWCRLPDGGGRWSHDCVASPNAPNWERRPAGPLEVKIFEAKRLTHNAWVRVTGRVTAPPGVLGARYMYIQDETAGILIYLPKDHRLAFDLGDRVRVVGNLKTFREEFEIVVGERSNVDFLEAGPPPPPLPIATTSLLEPYEGLLVLLQGQAVRFRGRSTLWLDDGTDPAQVVIRASTGIRKPFIERGSFISAVGIVSQSSDPDHPSRQDYRLLPRYQFDLIFPQSAMPETLVDEWPQLLPETGD